MYSDELKQYKFKLAYLSDGKIKQHEEFGSFLDDGWAYAHFQNLCRKFNVGPYYYLCKWKEVLIWKALQS